MAEGNENLPSIVLDNQGYVYAGGVKVARFVRERNSLQFLDRDRKRSEDRGSRFVEVPLIDLQKISDSG